MADGSSKFKSTLTSIGKINVVESTIEKLFLEKELSEEEKTFVLSFSIVLWDEYMKNKENQFFIDFAYYIILKYSIMYDDYKPLYDFSYNWGFYPVIDFINKKELIEKHSIESVILNKNIEKFRDKEKNITQTYKQKKLKDDILYNRKDLIANENIAYIAPTSYGKSSLIIEHIKLNLNKNKKVAVIVPTKSLLLQTYKGIMAENLDAKIILHDQMYNDEDKVVAILTQERALRLLEKVEWGFDFLYIDEAHNLLSDDLRSILLSRLIRLNKHRNNNSGNLYLSPLIGDVKNLLIKNGEKIQELRIDNSMKAPEIYVLDGGVKYKYNKFFNKYYALSKENSWSDYIINNSSNKSMLYLNSPRKIELFAKKFSSQLIEDTDDEDIKEIALNLGKYVHKDFNAINYLKNSIIYIHGQMPDYIKDYLEHKFKTVKSIKYIVSNSVILEGINLPIESLFVVDPYSLKYNRIINLIGRVNRLNDIFSDYGKLEMLLPKIHFIKTSSDFFNGKIKTYVERLRDTRVKDYVENPTLKEFDQEKDGDSESLKTVEEEEIYFSPVENELGELYKNLISLGLNKVYNIDKNFLLDLKSRIIVEKSYKMFKPTIMEVINRVLLTNYWNIVDQDIKRLQNDAAIRFYSMYLNEYKNKSIQENIYNQVRFFKSRKEKGIYSIFVGKSFGENNTQFADIYAKTDKELVNLAIVKLKVEDNFVSYKLSKLVELLYMYELITEDDYNLYTYGFTNKAAIEIVKQGMPSFLLSKLIKDDQFKNIEFDDYNILKGNDGYKEYYNKQDDFTKFQLKRYVSEK